MKVLFLYTHEYHATPLLRSREALLQYGIDLCPYSLPTVEHCGTESVSVVNTEACFNNYPLSDVPWRWPDVVILQTPPLYENVLNCGKPVVLFERIDGAQLRASRYYMHRVAGLIKGYVFRDREDYNRIHDRYHVDILGRMGITCGKPKHCTDRPVQIADSDFDKIQPVYGFGALEYLRPLIETVVDLDAPRRYDVQFAGTVDRYDDSEVQVHRQLACECVEAWNRKRRGRAVVGRGRVIQKPEYNLSILKSKTVVSPWGWGEACYRDYEAMALGAIVIKPPSYHVEAYPDILTIEYVVYCDADFSNVHDWIQHISHYWDGQRKARQRCRDTVVQHFQPEQIAKRIAQVLQSFTA